LDKALEGVPQAFSWLPPAYHSETQGPEAGGGGKIDSKPRSLTKRRWAVREKDVTRRENLNSIREYEIVNRGIGEGVRGERTFVKGRCTKKEILVPRTAAQHFNKNFPDEIPDPRGCPRWERPQKTF